MAVGYVVSFGRRWSVLEYFFLLIELADQRHSVAVADASILAERLGSPYKPPPRWLD